MGFGLGGHRGMRKPDWIRGKFDPIIATVIQWMRTLTRQGPHVIEKSLPKIGRTQSIEDASSAGFLPKERMMMEF